MSRDVWLHCGSFKSGSSRIQKLAWTRRDELLGAGWLYPRAGLVTDEPDVGVRHSDLVYLHRDPAVWQAMVDDLTAEIDGSPASHVLLSSEAWSRPGKGEALSDLLAALRSAGVVDEVHAVLYLRNRYAYARSFYRELTRRRDNVLPLAEFVDATPRPLDYVDTVRTLREAVTPGDLRVFPYDGLDDTGAHFFGLLGLEMPLDVTRENLGLDAVEVEAHRQLNLLAPDLRAEWPGVSADRVDLSGDWAERFRDGQLAPDPAWRAAFAEEVGWPESEVEAVLAPPEEPGTDVTELAGLLRGVVQAWLDRECAPVAEVTTYPHPLVEDLVVDEPDLTGSRFRLGGLLLAPEGGRLLAVGDDELEGNRGRPSPAYARRHPDDPRAATARFAVPRCSFGAHGRIDLVWEQPSGERSVLATLRRRWQKR